MKFAKFSRKPILQIICKPLLLKIVKETLKTTKRSPTLIHQTKKTEGEGFEVVSTTETTEI